jgi:very-short-patch-repair endonuclease
MPITYNGENIVLARNLRKKATPQEKHLWYDFLKDYVIKFQRQKAVGEYIVDFYCPSLKLAIEIDGNQHYSKYGLEKDKIRTEEINKQGIQVIRITNKQIDKDFNWICEFLDKEIQKIKNNQY